jgi:hypothetical protein
VRTVGDSANFRMVTTRNAGAGGLPSAPGRALFSSPAHTSITRKPPKLWAMSAATSRASSRVRTRYRRSSGAIRYDASLRAKSRVPVSTRPGGGR